MAVDYVLEKQYRSMCRSFEKLKELTTGIGRSIPLGNHEPMEAAKNFFAECCHLKDYLKKDSRIGNRKDVERYVRSCQFLPIAEEFCNSFKHAGASRSGNKIEAINVAYTVDIPLNGGKVPVMFGENPVDGDTFTINRTSRVGSIITMGRVVLTIAGKPHEALEIGEKCISEWDAFIAQQNIQLLPP